MNGTLEDRVSALESTVRTCKLLANAICATFTKDESDMAERIKAQMVEILSSPAPEVD